MGLPWLEGSWWALSVDGKLWGCSWKPSRLGAGPRAVRAVPKLLEESGWEIENLEHCCSGRTCWEVCSGELADARKRLPVDVMVTQGRRGSWGQVSCHPWPCSYPSTKGLESVPGKAWLASRPRPRGENHIQQRVSISASNTERVLSTTTWVCPSRSWAPLPVLRELGIPLWGGGPAGRLQGPSGVREARWTQ